MFERIWDNLRAAHRWATTSGAVEAAERLLIATYWYAMNQLRHEYLEWGERTIALHRGDRVPHPMVTGATALFHTIAGDAELGAVIARAGIAGAPSPDHPDTHLCWFALCISSRFILRPGERRDAAMLPQRAGVLGTQIM